MRKMVLAIPILLLAAASAYADCYYFSSGLPTGPECAETCSAQGPLPEGQCCYECQATPSCVVAFVLPCPGGNGGGSGQCSGQRCTENLRVRPGDAQKAPGMRPSNPDPVVRSGHLESVCFYFKDGSTVNLKFPNPPARGDNLAIHNAIVEVALQHRKDALALGKERGREDQMVMAAVTDQWATGPGEGGLSCREGRSRSGMKIYHCSCDAAGSGCIRVIVQ